MQPKISAAADQPQKCRLTVPKIVNANARLGERGGSQYSDIQKCPSDLGQNVTFFQLKAALDKAHLLEKGQKLNQATIDRCWTEHRTVIKTEMFNDDQDMSNLTFDPGPIHSTPIKERPDTSITPEGRDGSPVLPTKGPHQKSCFSPKNTAACVVHTASKESGRGRPSDQGHYWQGQGQGHGQGQVSSGSPSHSSTISETLQRSVGVEGLMAKHRREIGFLVAELRDRDRELNEMVRSHQQQMGMWEQDKQTIMRLQHHCQRLTAELSHQKIEGGERQGGGGDRPGGSSNLSSRLTQHPSNSLNDSREFLQAKEQEIINVLKLKEKRLAEQETVCVELRAQVTALRREKQCWAGETQQLLRVWQWRCQSLQSDKDKLMEACQEKDSQLHKATSQLQDTIQQALLLQQALTVINEQEQTKDELLASQKARHDRLCLELNKLRNLYKQQNREMTLLQLTLNTSKGNEADQSKSTSTTTTLSTSPSSLSVSSRLAPSCSTSKAPGLLQHRTVQEGSCGRAVERPVRNTAQYASGGEGDCINIPPTGAGRHSSDSSGGGSGRSSAVNTGPGHGVSRSHSDDINTLNTVHSKGGGVVGGGVDRVHPANTIHGAGRSSGDSGGCGDSGANNIGTPPTNCVVSEQVSDHHHRPNSSRKTRSSMQGTSSRSPLHQPSTADNTSHSQGNSVHYHSHRHQHQQQQISPQGNISDSGHKNNNSCAGPSSDDHHHQHPRAHENISDSGHNINSNRSDSSSSIVHHNHHHHPSAQKRMNVRSVATPANVSINESGVDSLPPPHPHLRRHHHQDANVNNNNNVFVTGFDHHHHHHHGYQDAGFDHHHHDHQDTNVNTTTNNSNSSRDDNNSTAHNSPQLVHYSNHPARVIDPQGSPPHLYSSSSSLPPSSYKDNDDAAEDLNPVQDVDTEAFWQKILSVRRGNQDNAEERKDFARSGSSAVKSWMLPLDSDNDDDEDNVWTNNNKHAVTGHYSRRDCDAVEGQEGMEIQQRSWQQSHKSSPVLANRDQDMRFQSHYEKSSFVVTDRGFSPSVHDANTDDAKLIINPQTVETAGEDIFKVKFSSMSEPRRPQAHHHHHSHPHQEQGGGPSSQFMRVPGQQRALSVSQEVIGVSSQGGTEHLSQYAGQPTASTDLQNFGMRDLKHDLQHGLKHDLKHDLHHDIKYDLQHDLKHDLKHDLQHDLEPKPSGEGVQSMTVPSHRVISESAAVPLFSPFEEKLSSFLESPEDNNSFNPASQGPSSPASKLHRLLLESQEMLQSLEGQPHPDPW